MKNIILILSTILILCSCKKDTRKPIEQVNNARYVDITLYNTEPLYKPIIYVGGYCIVQHETINSSPYFTVSYHDTMSTVRNYIEGKDVTAYMRIWKIHSQAKKDDLVTFQMDATISQTTVDFFEEDGTAISSYVDHSNGKTYLQYKVQ